jgi:serine/threonine protein kinase
MAERLLSLIRQSLQSYVRGQFDWQQLVDSIRSAVATENASRQAVEYELDSAAREGLISQEIVAALKTAVMHEGRQDETVIPGRSASGAASQGSGKPLPDATAIGVDPDKIQTQERLPRSPVDDVQQPRSAEPHGSGAADNASSSAEVTVGMVINSRFRLVEVLGEGGMGVVYRALDERRREARDKNQYVAVKVLGNVFKQHGKAWIGLQREAGRAQTLAHPNIVTVYDFDRDGDIVYMTMELLEGEPIDRLIARHAKRGGLPYSEALPIVRGMCAALKHAHEKEIVHSDFKPSNVFVVTSGAVKVLDFGIAREARSPGTSKSDTIFNAQAEFGALSPAYASPEMLLGMEPDARDDIYALACVTYKLLSGEHPFQNTPGHHAMHAAMRVKPISGLRRRPMSALRRGLAFRREQRSRSVEHFIGEFEQPKFFNQRRRRAAAIVGAIALVAGGYGIYYWSQHCERLNETFVTSLMQGEDRLSAQSDLWETAEEAEEARRDLRQTAAVSIAAARQIINNHDSPDTFDAGQLAENSDFSAYGLFSQALEIDRSSEAAARGILTIVELFVADASRQLEAGNVVEAGERIDFASEIFPEHCGLNRLVKAMP